MQILIMHCKQLLNKFYILSVFLLTCLNVFAQNYNNAFEISVKGEEPLNNFKVISDQYNRIWVGNTDGLYLFNGENYTQIKDNSNGKLSFNPMFLKFTKENELMYGTHFGLSKLKNGELIQIESPLIKDLTFIDMLERDTKTKLFATSTGIYEYKNNSFKCQIKGKTFNSFLNSKNGIYALANDGVYKNEKDTWVLFVKYNFKYIDLNRIIFEINNEIYFGEDTLFKIVNNQIKATKFIFPNLLKNLKIYENNRYFSSGSFIYSFNGTDLNEVFENQYVVISDYCFDFYGNIIIADFYNLQYLEKKTLNLRTIEFKDNELVLFVNSQNESFFLNKTDLIHRKNNTNSIIKYNKSKFKDLSNIIFYNVKYDTLKQQYYIFSDIGLLLIFKNELFYFDELNKDIKEDYFRCLNVCFYKGERYLIFENKIVVGYNQFKTILDTSQNKILMNSFEQCFFDNKLFFGGSRGFGFFDFETKKIIDATKDLKRFLNEKYFVVSNIAANNEVIFIKVKNKNLILCYFKNKTLNFQLSEEKSFDQLIIDKKNNLWLINKRHLSCYQIKRSFEKYYLNSIKKIQTDKFIYDILKFPVFYKLSLSDFNTINIFTSKLITSLDLNNQDTISTITPIVFLKKISINEEDFSLNDELRNNKLIFKKGFFKNSIEFAIGSVFLDNLDNVKYRYKVIGLFDDWQFIETHSNINVQSVGIGNYKLIVQASFDGIEWGDKYELDFIILAPWYLTSFMIIIYLIIACLIIYLIVLKIQNIKRRKTIINQKITESELKALRSQINPHYLSNSLMSLQDAILSDEKFKAFEIVGQYGKVMRNILENSELSFVSLKTEINTIKEYVNLESLLHFNDLKFNFNTNIVEDLQNQILLPSMLIQPFVENAIIHGLMKKTIGPKILEITFDFDEILVCTIRDNGVGRSTNQNIKRTSMGIKNIENRLKLYGDMLKKNIKVEIIDEKDVHQQALGTTVVVHLPYKIEKTSNQTFEEI